MSLTVHGIPVIDIDSHYTEPPDLWTSRAPAKYKDAVPHIVINDEGNQRWQVLDDIDFGPPGFTVVQDDGTKAYGTISLASFDQMSKAATDPKERLKLLDQLGIAQQIVYPNVAGFGSQNFIRIEDDELRNICCTIYNDAVAEFQDAGDGRLFPQGLVPFWDIPAAVDELKRIGDMGMTGITMCDTPEAFGLPHLSDPAWDPFWDTCQDMGMPVNFHIGAGAGVADKLIWPGYGPQRQLALTSIALFITNFKVIINLIFSGLCERYPNLNFVSVESGIGWVPFLLEAMDYQFEETVPTEREGLTMKPSEYFRRQIFASFWFEDFGPRATIQGDRRRQRHVRDRLPSPDLPLSARTGTHHRSAHRPRRRHPRKGPAHHSRAHLQPAARSRLDLRERRGWRRLAARTPSSAETEAPHDGTTRR